MQTIQIDLSSMFYYPVKLAGKRKKIMPTSYNLGDYLYDALMDDDIKLENGKFVAVTVKPEEKKKRNRLAMRVERYAEEGKLIEFSQEETKMLKELIFRPLEAGYKNIVQSQALAYIEGDTSYEDIDNCPLYYKKLYETASKLKYEIQSIDYINSVMNAVQNSGKSIGSQVRMLLDDLEVEKIEAPSDILLMYLKEKEVEDFEEKSDKKPETEESNATESKETEN